MQRLCTLAVVLLLASVACRPTQAELANGDDPIAALGSTVRSSRYGPKYWREQQASQSKVWKAALATCESTEHANRPNCELVAAVQFGTTPAPGGNPFRSEKGLNP